MGLASEQKTSRMPSDWREADTITRQTQVTTGFSSPCPARRQGPCSVRHYNRTLLCRRSEGIVQVSFFETPAPAPRLMNCPGGEALTAPKSP